MRHKKLLKSIKIMCNHFLMTCKDKRYDKKVKSKVNIIEYNPIDDGEFKQTTRERLKAFTDHLEKNGIICNVRHSRGKDIDAACGQLANKNKLAMEQLK